MPGTGSNNVWDGEPDEEVAWEESDAEEILRPRCWEVGELGWTGPVPLQWEALIDWGWLLIGAETAEK